MKRIFTVALVGAISLSPVPAFACGSSDSYSAQQCIVSVQNPNGGWYLQNVCNQKINAIWCVQGSTSTPCRSGNRWWSSSWEIGAGNQYRVGSGGGHTIKYGACRYRFWDN